MRSSMRWQTTIFPLDDALKLYEEAVQLGLRASSLLEENLQENNALYDEERSEDVQGCR